MNGFILILQTFAAAVLIVFIIVQVKGTGFGRVWGAQASFARRGLERLVFRATFVVSGLFIVLSILALLA